MSQLIELKKDGFLDKPKFLKEIMGELRRRGHPYNRTSISKPLLKAVQLKELERIGKPKQWQYVSK